MIQIKKRFIFVAIMFVLFYFLLTIDFDEKFQTAVKPKPLLDTKITAKDIPSSVYTNTSFTVAAWNIQILGPSKGSNDELMAFYVDVIDDHDLFIVQELKDMSGEVFTKLCDALNEAETLYGCLNSSRAGSTNNKEQYAVFYKLSEFKLTEFYDYNERQYIALWERPPLRLRLERNGVEFAIYTIHTKPTEAKAEIAYLHSTTMRDRGPMIVIGDLNADCGYYKPNDTDFASWYWIIKHNDDTTVGNSDCAYDRIIVNTDMRKYYMNTYGITMQDITSVHSDHYPIWAMFDI
jgi:deoxyribonuclease-1-like protein